MTEAPHTIKKTAVPSKLPRKPASVSHKGPQKIYSHVVYVRVTKQEWQTIQVRANNSGLSMSRYLVQMAFEGSPPRPKPTVFVSSPFSISSVVLPLPSSRSQRTDLLLWSGETKYASFSKKQQAFWSSSLKSSRGALVRQVWRRRCLIQRGSHSCLFPLPGRANAGEVRRADALHHPVQRGS